MLEIQIAGSYSKCGTTSEPMIPEIVVAIGLWWLAGGRYIIICHAMVVSLLHFIDAVIFSLMLY